MGAESIAAWQLRELPFVFCAHEMLGSHGVGSLLPTLPRIVTVSNVNKLSNRLINVLIRRLKSTLQCGFMTLSVVPHRDSKTRDLCDAVSREI